MVVKPLSLLAPHLLANNIPSLVIAQIVFALSMLDSLTAQRRKVFVTNGSFISQVCAVRRKNPRFVPYINYYMNIA